jgi:endonuclease-3
MRFDAVIKALKKEHGRPKQRAPVDPWKHILWENVGYLVSDERRAVAFRALEKKTKLSPDAILRCKPKALAKVIVEGGMLAEHRAEKVIECARVVRKLGGVEALVTAVEEADGAKLKRFPGIGEPGADRILLLAHQKRTLAPDSNALRVMARLGWFREQKSYGRTYASAIAKTKKALPKKWPDLIAAHQLLRAHGQSTCTRNAPACDACSLSRRCPKKGVE